ncbi:related to WD40-repeat protein (notchless protein), partial [Serendipita indica DSM 11827]
TIRLWDAKTGEPVGDPLRGHSDSVRAVAFSPDGSRIVSGSDDQTIRLWDAKSGEPVGDPLRGHSDLVTAVAISQGGSQLVSGSQDNTIRLWDTDIVLPSKHLFQHRVDQDNATASLPENLAIISGSTTDMGPVSPEAFGGADSRSQETEGTPRPSDIPQEMDGIPLSTLIPGFKQCSLLHDGWVQSSDNGMPAASTSVNDLSTSGVSVLSLSQVIDSLENVVENAKISGDLKSYESFVEDAVDAGIKYQIRLCPALAPKHKERAPTPNIAPDASNITAAVQTTTQTDPFLPHFNSLRVGELRDGVEEDSSEGYNVLLNKFGLIKGHFLLVTKGASIAVYV